MPLSATLQRQLDDTVHRKVRGEIRMERPREKAGLRNDILYVALGKFRDLWAWVQITFEKGGPNFFSHVAQKKIGFAPSIIDTGRKRELYSSIFGQ